MVREFEPVEREAAKERQARYCDVGRCSVARDGARPAGSCNATMATTTRQPLVCECGRIGALKCRENDAPFSSPWESYSLKGFEGGTADFLH
jgi:hypothetical protein